MANTIGSNPGLLRALSGLNQINQRIGVSQARVSSAERINSARDDAAGIAIKSRFEAQLSGYTQAIRNAGDGISLAQTAEGALGSVNNALQRINELSLQAANGSLNNSDREALQAEASGLVAQINDTVTHSNFNGVSLLKNDSTLSFAVSEDGINPVEVNTKDLTSFLDSVNNIDLSTQAGANSALTAVRTATDTISEQRIDFGAVQSRFESTIENLQSSFINESEALSRINDTDFAAELANLARDTILEKSTTAMISQANSDGNLILKLLSP